MAARKRQAAFDKMDSLELPKIERVKFQRWNLGMALFQKVQFLQMSLILLL